MFKAVLFDLDGTLGDTLPLCVAALRHAVSEQAGREFRDEEVVAEFGKSEQGIVRKLIPERHDAGMESFHRFYAEKLEEMCPKPFPGIVAALAMLRERGVALAIVTGKGPESARITLEKYGLTGYFTDIEVGDPAGPNKVERIQAILARRGLKPEDVLYVGDVPSDVTAARKAGVAIYSVAWAATAEPEKLAAQNPDAMFRTVEEFAECLRRMP